LSLTLACPQGYDPPAEDLTRAQTLGADVHLVRDPREAVRDADVVSTDVFASMGQEAEHGDRLRAFRGFMLTHDLLSNASRDHIVLHCLPAHRGEEIDAEVLEGPNSAVWEQAEARLHTAKAALVWALGVDD